MVRKGAVILLAAALLPAVPGAGGAAPHPAARSAVAGHSVEGRAIRVWEAGDAHASRRVLVVGCVHGTERAGEAITHRLRDAQPPLGAELLVVDRFNPDGCAAGTRQNAHGVDLNRNSPRRWRPVDRPGGTYYSGPRPLSEPESRAIVRLVKRFRPAISIWYHQHARRVVKSGGDPRVEHRYARLVGLPYRSFGPRPPGSITSWQNTAFPADSAFVVELPAGALPERSVARHVRAVLRLAAGP